MSEIQYNKETGHIIGCKWEESLIYYSDGTKFKKSCSIEDCKDGNLSRQDCHEVDENGEIIFRCAKHYEKWCEEKGWTKDLSHCANIKCDSKELNLRQRKKIHHKNIKKELGLPADKKYKHVSNSLRKYIDEHADIENSDDDSDLVSESDNELDDESDNESNDESDNELNNESNDDSNNESNDESDNESNDESNDENKSEVDFNEEEQKDRIDEINELIAEHESEIHELKKNFTLIQSQTTSNNDVNKNVNKKRKKNESDDDASDDDVIVAHKSKSKKY
jgi:hypothetical protein